METLKSCTLETLNLLRCADNCTNTKTDRIGQKKEKTNHVLPVFSQVSHVTLHMLCAMCRVSCIMCCMLCVTCKLPLTSTSRATDPSHANSIIMQSLQRPKHMTKYKTPKKIETTKTLKRLEVCQYYQYAL